MRPLTLTMQAFGPYAEREVIDFRELGNRTMFVISGKTGSGKTTIFDGISFAIYGRASGEDRNPAELRSQFAKDDDITEVELTFHLRGKTYHIKRSPQQEKKKVRGDGFTTVNSAAELFVFDENGERKILGSNVREVDEKIKELVQLDVNQFRQILMIPQGEFRKLLTSDSSDKEIILQKLFHTEIYKMIQEKLKVEADELNQLIQSTVEKRTRELLRIQTEEHHELKELLLENPLRDRKVLSLLPEHIEKQVEGLNALQLDYEKQLTSRDAVQKQLLEAESLLVQFKQKEELIQKLHQLEGLSESIENKKSQIILAQKATRLVQQEEYCHKLSKNLKELKSQYDYYVKEYAKLQEEFTSATERFEVEKSREEERAHATKQVNQLEAIAEDVQSFAELNQAVQQLQNKRMKQNEELQANVEKLKQSKVKSDQVEEQLRQLDSSKEKLLESKAFKQVLSNQIELLKETFESDKQLQVERNRLEKVAKDHEGITLQLKDAKETQSFLENNWYKGQAGLLAQQLSDGQNCPVCGSDHHPSPAHLEVKLPSEEDLKAAKQDVQKLEQKERDDDSKRIQLLEKTNALQNQLNRGIEKIKDFSNTFQIEECADTLSRKQRELQNLENQIASLEKEIEQAQTLREQFEEIKQFRVNLEKQQEKLQEDIRISQDEYTKQHTTLEKVKETIPESLRKFSQYQAALQQAQKHEMKLKEDFQKAQTQFYEVEKLVSIKNNQMEELKHRTNQAEAEMKAERNQFVVMLQEQGFSDYRSFEQAKKTEEQVESLQQEVQQYREDLRSVRDLLAQTEKNIENKEAPDIDEINAMLQEASTKLAEINEKVNEQKVSIRENKSVLENVNKINEDIQVQEERYQSIGLLSSLARGQNANRITFERYVLASFLEDILYIANERLLKMTSGRYQLIRKKDRSKGNVQSGLELLVFDQYTGQERHVKTLSGGESFKASLALALGLADVVQQYAGGVSLETMFIDEGFGTLDPESLDHAIEALMDIQSSGRLVGLISHVPELKERIDVRLEVISSQSGSRTEFQFIR